MTVLLIAVIALCTAPLCFLAGHVIHVLTGGES